MTKKTHARSKSPGRTPSRKPALPGWPADAPVPPWVLTTENGGVAATPEMLAGLAWESRWAAFRAKTPAWAGTTVSSEPVYALPGEVVDELTDAAPPKGSSREKKPLITADEAGAERAFLKLCRSYGRGVVGVWNGQPVRYDLLGPPPPPVKLTREEFDMLGWGRLKEAGLSDTPMSYGTCLHEIREREKAADRSRTERLAAAGWVTFNPTYRSELAGLKDRAAALGVPLAWPFVPGSLVGGVASIPAGSTAMGPPASELVEDLKRFAWRWKLSSLETWDLPVPQGPLSSVPVGLLVRLVDPGQPATTTPGYGRGPAVKPGKRPRSPAEAKTVPPPAAVTGKKGQPSGYATGFRMWFVEHTARSRYSSRRGLADRLAAAFGKIHGIGDDRIGQIRRLYIHLFRASSS